MGRLEDVADLGGGVGEDLGIRIGGGTGGVARMGEEVGRAPQEAVRSMCPRASSTIVSNRAHDSAKVSPAGAMSRSWKQ
jgi:hypothetical protein